MSMHVIEKVVCCSVGWPKKTGMPDHEYVDSNVILEELYL